MKKTIKIKGMHCTSCEVLLKEAIEEQGVNVLQTDHKKGEIIVDIKEEKQLKVVQQAVEKEGYSFT